MTVIEGATLTEVLSLNFGIYYFLHSAVTNDIHGHYTSFCLEMDKKNYRSFIGHHFIQWIILKANYVNKYCKRKFSSIYILRI